MSNRMTKWDREPEVTTDAYGITWKENFGVYSAKVGGVIDVVVDYDNSKFKVVVNGLTLKTRTDSVGEGKELAVKFLKNKLSFLF